MNDPIREYRGGKGVDGEDMKVAIEPAYSKADIQASPEDVSHKALVGVAKQIGALYNDVTDLNADGQGGDILEPSRNYDLCMRVGSLSPADRKKLMMLVATHGHSAIIFAMPLFMDDPFAEEFLTPAVSRDRLAAESFIRSCATTIDKPWQISVLRAAIKCFSLRGDTDADEVILTEQAKLAVYCRGGDESNVLGVYDRESGNPNFTQIEYGSPEAPPPPAS